MRQVVERGAQLPKPRRKKTQKNGEDDGAESLRAKSVLAETNGFFLLRVAKMEWMKGFSKFLILVLFMTVAFTQTAGAVPVEWGPSLDSRIARFYDVTNPAVEIAEVVCNVYYHDSSAPHANQYVYTYQITNTSSDDTGLSFFSVSILTGSTVESPEHDSNGVLPLCWDIIDSPLERVEALFSSSIDSGQNSALLWFFSDYESTSAGGALSGMSSAGYVFATADDLLTPIPEPATVTLLGMGGLVLLWRKRST